MEKDMYDEVERLLKAQRHEFINHLQVIHAMIEIGQTGRAMKYIENLARNPGLLTEQED